MVSEDTIIKQLTLQAFSLQALGLLHALQRHIANAESQCRWIVRMVGEDTSSEACGQGAFLNKHWLCCMHCITRVNADSQYS